MVTAAFEDGGVERGDLLIGAEGAHSVVRKSLFGPEKAALQMSPLVASAAMAKLPRDAALKFREITRRLMVTFHPEGYFNWIGGEPFILIKLLKCQSDMPECTTRMRGRNPATGRS